MEERIGPKLALDRTSIAAFYDHLDTEATREDDIADRPHKDQKVAAIDEP